MSILAPQADFVRPEKPLTWQGELRRAVRDPAQLAELLELPPEWAAQAAAAAEQFPLLAPRPYVARMSKGNPSDPLLRQVLPVGDELEAAVGFVADPVADAQSQLMPGLLHKYPGRALLVTTGACAVHCRYCFRRHYPYEKTPKGAPAWRPALSAIADDPSIYEVILSGGDPLTLVDATLAELVRQIEKIPHVARLRIHTRLPIMVPSRVNDELLEWLTGTRLTPMVVLHANHANELDAQVAASLRRLTDSGVPLLNQAVLLRGVNDTLKAQAELCEKLINLRVIPYYLHQLDRVAGAAHFEASEQQGLRIVEQLRATLPGYAIPKYVQEVAGRPSKTEVGSEPGASAMGVIS